MLQVKTFNCGLFRTILSFTHQNPGDPHIISDQSAGQAAALLLIKCDVLFIR